ncbi:MAG TPA: pilus assembly protein TadB [Propionibacteriaceae bacterium]|jgi:tight adherence protein B|nr:pilus assembly protein TadB [Propionibacteriaceae bacterium]
MMALLCLACAALAVWWGMPPPRPERPAGSAESMVGPQSGAVSLPGSLARPAPPAPLSKPLRWLLLGGLASVLIVVVALLLDGGRGAVLGLALLLLGWTVTGLLRHHQHARLVRRGRAEVAQACAALAAQLRVGQVPSVALATAAGDHPVLREARDAQDLGGDVVRVWRVQARQAGDAGLLELARAWQVSGRTGAPMSAALEQVAAALAAEQDLRAVVAGELSAPRATGKVMAVLPGCGVALGYLLGGEPIGWLLGGPLGWACLLTGAVLACLGVLWIEALARRAAV